MSMNQDTENFEQLRRLLKLKRYEQPPPGYFYHFSGQVIARIQDGERGEDRALIGRLLWEAPWLQRIWTAFETKPALAGAFGLVMCGLLIAGLVYSETADVEPVALIPATKSVRYSPVVASGVAGANHPLLTKPAPFEASSTDPLATILTDGPAALGAQPFTVGFPLPARN